MNFSLADISGPDPQHQEKGVCKRLSQFFITIIAQREYETQRISFGISGNFLVIRFVGNSNTDANNDSQHSSPFSQSFRTRRVLKVYMIFGGNAF